MSALRLARAFTGRDKIIKFAGGYHGHSDGLLVKAGSGLATLGTPDSAGVTTELRAAIPWWRLITTLNAVEQLFERYPAEDCRRHRGAGGRQHGRGPAQPGFLEGLRESPASYGALLIFDEVITGFRVAYGGAQALFGVTPDLTTLGKIIGGGLRWGPMAAAGKSCRLVAPLGPVYQAGTLSGNPLAMAAGIATIKSLRDPEVYRRLEEKSSALKNGIAEAAAEASAKVSIARAGSLLTVFFTSDAPQDYQSAQKSDMAISRIVSRTTIYRDLLAAVTVRGRLCVFSSFRQGHPADNPGVPAGIYFAAQ